MRGWDASPSLFTSLQCIFCLHIPGPNISARSLLPAYTAGETYVWVPGRARMGSGTRPTVLTWHRRRETKQVSELCGARQRKREDERHIEVEKKDLARDGAHEGHRDVHLTTR